jgi:hypothetical protein
MSDYSIFQGRGVKVSLVSDDDFLKIRETLTRIGVASKDSNKLYQSCHILHKQGLYAIVHFKELFILDGKSANYTDEDEARRNTIAMLLEEWGLLDIVDGDGLEEKSVPPRALKIVPFREKDRWELIPKYTIGKLR